MIHGGTVDREITMGAVTVRIEHAPDHYPDLSCYGEFSGYQTPRTQDQKLVHRATGLVLDHYGMWRDSRGRIQQEPGDRHATRYGREHAYTFHSNGHDKIKYAIADAERLEDYERGCWEMLGIVVTVVLNGAEIGTGSLWGIESDSDQAYLDSMAREVTREAIAAARIWIERFRAA